MNNNAFPCNVFCPLPWLPEGEQGDEEVLQSLSGRWKQLHHLGSGPSPKPHLWGIKAVLLRATGNKYTKNWSIFVWKDLLWLWASGGIAAWHGRMWGAGCRAQKCLQSCDAFPQGLESIAKCIAEEITPQQKCADCRKEATEPTQAGEAAFPLLFCCRSYGEQNKW